MKRYRLLGERIFKGYHYHDGISSVKIMSVVGNYVMARRSGCAPFVRSKKEFESQFEGPIPVGELWAFSRRLRVSSEKPPKP